MSAENFDLAEQRLEKALAEVYDMQMRHFFADDLMPELMEKMGIDENEAIELIGCLLERGWVKCVGGKQRFFLRPGYIGGMPVVLTSSGISKLKN
ncbi:hypothetical protein DCCM_3696 [Desulfocucumis palustris]|uniref:Uncharacterized protein n=1 Tax=Desulfocucumis palustris TaxID=1898651 RepID=A0A2L2XE01_9FIRM|nr:hypothetical protein [Desulfocucumis palustris]GBF34577.1 hypothetical protein DCCM_3696 [Desulfocucumis palustris]